MIKIKLNRILSYPLLNNTIKLSSSNLLALISLLIFTPIISRIYSPDLYGEWGVFSNVLLIFNCVLFLSYDNALIQTNNEKEIPQLLVLCILCAIGVTVIVNGFFIVGKFIGINFFITFPGFEFLALSFLLNAAYTLLAVMSNRLSLYGIISIVTIIYGLAQPLLRILIGVTYLSSNSLIYAYLLSSIIGIICYIAWTKNTICINWPANQSWMGLIQTAKKYAKYPIFDAPAAILESLCTCIVLIILSVYFKKEEIGCYTMVTQLIILPTSVIGSALSKVFFRELSVIANDEVKVKSLVIKTAKITFFLSCIPIIFFSLGGDILLGIFLGSKWIYAGRIVLCLSVFSLPIVLTEPLIPIFKTFNKQDIRFKFDVMSLFVTLLSLYVGIYIFDNFLKVLLLYSMGIAVMRFSLFYLQLHQVHVSPKDIQIYFYLIVVMCYFILGCRLCFYL